MRIPNYIWFLLIPIFAGALTEFLSRYYPVDTNVMSAAIVSLTGAIVAALAALKKVNPELAKPNTPEGAASLSAPAPAQPGYLKRWFIG
jgi:hypothetical protein